MKLADILGSIEKNEEENKIDTESVNDIDVYTSYIEQTIKAIEEVEEKCWSKGTGLKSTRFKEIEKATNGFEDGLYLIAGAANTGKSALMMNLAVDLATTENNDVFVMYFSLDDTLVETIPRIIAMDNKISIDVVRRPVKYENEHILLQKRKEGFEKLKTMAKNITFFDSDMCPFIEDIEDMIKKYKILLAKEGREETKFIIVIDAFNDLETKSKKFADPNDKSEYLSKKIKDMHKEFDAIVMCTTHLRKLNGYRRPINDDIKNSGTLVYEANLILLCHNEVGLRGEKADVYYTREDKVEKQPVIEVHFAKNKLSSFKGRVFTEFIPDYSYVEEATEEAARHYNSVVFN